MAASRRGQPPLSVHLPKPPTTLPDLPPISALFLIDFDVKAGYTIVWKRAAEGLELEGTVEYKSLPSGLHTVTDDLIYFVHNGGYAGLSAFINTKTEDEGARNARMIAVGVLVPLSYGRLGRAWRHAEALKEMAEKLSADKKQTDILEKYWDEHHAGEATSPEELRETPFASPVVGFKPTPAPAGKSHTRNRSQSDGGALIPPGHRLSPFHPAWSLTKLLETFGPLIFPIHRAALLRKRILIATHAPVHETCNFVYDLSIISNIPISVADLLEPSATAQRLKPLFTVGVHDIPTLAEYQKHNSSDEGNEAIIEDTGSGWVACTTDSILAMKGDLWDMLITMPPPHAANAKEKSWSTVESPKGVPVRATQRDMRRFRHLQRNLTRFASSAGAAPSKTTPQTTTNSTSTSPDRPSSGIKLGTRSGDAHIHPTYLALNETDYETEKVVEPTTWAALAYNGFMWWASAGEQRGEEAEETSRDSSLFADLGLPSMNTPGLGVADSLTNLGTTDEEDRKAQIELAIIAYFHRLTTQMLTVLADLVEVSEEDDEVDMDTEDDGQGLLGPDSHGDEESRNGPWVRVDSEALAAMGLDIWSSSDAAFVRELTPRYFARRAYVEGKGVEVCGLRVC